METRINALEREFDQYKETRTETERQLFWDAVAQETDQLTPEQRTARQQTVRADIAHILQRLTQIQQQLTAASQPA